MIATAIALASEAHKDQTDKAGQPYILHVFRVWETVKEHWGEEVQVAALLHDTVEDGHLTVDGIREQFGDRIADAVDALTRRESDKGRWDRYDYEEYIKRVACNDIAKWVKRADLEDNLNRTRIPNPTIADYERWGRYEWARDQLSCP